MAAGGLSGAGPGLPGSGLCRTSPPVLGSQGRGITGWWDQGILGFSSHQTHLQPNPCSDRRREWLPREYLWSWPWVPGFPLAATESVSQGPCEPSSSFVFLNRRRNEGAEQGGGFKLTSVGSRTHAQHRLVRFCGAGGSGGCAQGCRASPSCHRALPTRAQPAGSQAAPSGHLEPL